MTTLRPGTNQWVCIPGNENVIGATDMCANPMGMRWMLDLMAGKPKPSNTEPGLIYMLNGALQHSHTDPFDRTSPAIPIGPHWMLIWPFEAVAAGLSTVMRDAAPASFSLERRMPTSTFVDHPGRETSITRGIRVFDDGLRQAVMIGEPRCRTAVTSAAHRCSQLNRAPRTDAAPATAEHARN
jgi:hypothetical protein